MNPTSNNPYLLVRDDDSVHVHSIPRSERNKQNEKKKISPAFTSNYPPNAHAKENTSINKIILIICYDTNLGKNLDGNASSHNNTSPQPESNPIIIFLMKTQKIKEIPLTKIMNSSLLDLPSPSSISFL